MKQSTQTLLKVNVPIQEAWISGFSAFRIYCATKAHFGGSFDISKYGLSIRSNQQTYEKRKDRVFFERLASKLDSKQIYELMVYNLVANPDVLSYELSGSDAHAFYKQHKGKISRMKRVYRDDLRYIFELLAKNKKNFKDLLKGDGHPVILQLLIRQDISIESFLLIDSVIPVIKSIDRDYKGDPVWIKWHTKLCQYRKIVALNNTLAKDIMLDVKSQVHDL